MSRHPEKLTTPTSRQERVAEEFVVYISNTSTPKALKLEDVATEALQDPTHQAVMNAVRTNNWFEPAKHLEINQMTYRALERVRGELTVCSTHCIILRGTRNVIPENHAAACDWRCSWGPPGIAKAKSLLREKVWFAGIDSAVEKKVKSCLACQATTPETNREPLRISPLPAEGPWKEVGGLQGTVWRRILARCLRWLHEIPSCWSSQLSVIESRDTSRNKIFAEFGVPETVCSDNGPPFNSKEFKEFAQRVGFSHHRVTPLWPRANGEVERFMRTLKKSIEAAKVEHHP